MKIILEGPDGAGKTTLAQKLFNSTGYPVVHRSKPKDEIEKATMLNDYYKLCKSTEDVIMDRCWYSEIVYGQVMRDQSYISINEMWMLEQLILQNGGGLIIYCHGEIDILWERLQERGEDYIKDKVSLTDILATYNNLFSKIKHAIPVTNYVI